jgi:hypothetical protein
MPIVGPSSYVSTTEDFLAHWLAVDTALGAGNEVVLQGNIARSDLEALYNGLVAKRLELAGKLNIEETSREDVNLRKAAMLLRVNQFNELVRADFSGTKWEKALPYAPSINDGAGNFIPPLDDVSTLWLQLNADPATSGPVTLLGGYTQAQFATDVAALKTALTSWRSAGVIASITLQEREEIQNQIQPILVSYRKKVPTKFAKDHPLVNTIPDVTPAPGSTPNGVTIVAVWDEALQQARITFGASTSSDVVRYELRVCSGPNYDTNLESVVANIDVNAPREFLTDTGLIEPGNVASFKVYVITATGNEKGSNAETITRPTEA